MNFGPRNFDIAKIHTGQTKESFEFTVAQRLPRRLTGRQPEHGEDATDEQECEPRPIPPGSPFIGSFLHIFSVERNGKPGQVNQQLAAPLDLIVIETHFTAADSQLRFFQ